MSRSLHGALLLQMHPDVSFADPVSHEVGSYGPEAVAASEVGSSSIMPTAPVFSSGLHLVGDVWLIGREKDCSARVDARRTDVSRKHATIRREGDTYTLYDHSRHGTYVNHIQILGPCRLDTADVIGVGATREMLRFVNYDQIAPFAQILSEREHEVLRILATGLSVKQIADELKISQNTVQTHLRHLYEKLEVNSREEAVAKARKLQLLHHP